MSREKELAIAILTEKIQKLTNKKVTLEESHDDCHCGGSCCTDKESLKEAFVESPKQVWKVIGTDGRGSYKRSFDILTYKDSLKKMLPELQKEFPAGWTVSLEWVSTPRIYKDSNLFKGESIIKEAVYLNDKSEFLKELEGIYKSAQKPFGITIHGVYLNKVKWEMAKEFWGKNESTLKEDITSEDFKNKYAQIEKLGSEKKYEQAKRIIWEWTKAGSLEFKDFLELIASVALWQRTGGFSESVLKEGTWALGSIKDLLAIKRELKLFKDKVYKIAGDDEFYNGLDSAETRLEELIAYRKANKS